MIAVKRITVASVLGVPFIFAEQWQAGMHSNMHIYTKLHEYI